MLTTGPITNINQSDNIYVDLDPDPTANPIKQKVDLILIAESPVSNPTSLSFRVDAFMSGGPVGDVIQTVSFRNELTGVMEVIDTRPASDAEQLIEVAPTGDLTRFVHPLTDEITAKVTWESESFSGTPFFWSLKVDQLVWMLGE